MHQPAVVDHADALGEGSGVIEGVRDQQRGEPQPGENVCEFVAYLLAGDCVECAERLVEQQHAGLACERACERHALALPAGQLPGSRGREVCDPEPLEQVWTVALAGEAHICGDGEVREQPVVLG